MQQDVTKGALRRPEMDLTDGPSEQELPANPPNAGGGTRTRTGIALRCLRDLS